MNKNKIIGIGIVSIALISCNNQKNVNTNTNTNIVDTSKNKSVGTIVSQPVIQPKEQIFANLKKDVKKLNDIMNRYYKSSQTFEVLSNDSTQIKGNQGTIIYLKPNDLETISGKPIGKNIKVVLKEMTNQTQLLYNNAQTVSDRKLLISGGAYYIKMTSNGQKLKIKEGKTLKVVFPKLSKEEMCLFYGKRDSIDNMNWKQAEQKFRTNQITITDVQKLRNVPRSKWYRKKTTISKFVRGMFTDETLPFTFELTKDEKKKLDDENTLLDKAYMAMNISSLGYINCDRFFNCKKTELHVIFDSTENITLANLYVVFKDINSVMGERYYKYKEFKYCPIFSIPINYKVRLVACTIKDGKVFSYVSDHTVKNKLTLTLTLKETSEKELEKLLNAPFLP